MTTPIYEPEVVDTRDWYDLLYDAGEELEAARRREHLRVADERAYRLHQIEIVRGLLDAAEQQIKGGAAVRLCAQDDAERLAMLSAAGCTLPEVAALEGEVGRA